MAEPRPTVREIVDPPKPSGIVMTQMMSPKGHAMYHPVFQSSPKGSGEPPSGVTTKPDFERMKTDFVGVCMSNTYVKGKQDRVKRRRSATPRMAIAVAGTVTIPYYPSAEIVRRPPKPGDLVAFAKDGDAVLAGTEDNLFSEVVPRVCRFSAQMCLHNYSTAPFGVCVALNAAEQQITVLLRLDLYRTHQYVAPPEDAAAVADPEAEAPAAEADDSGSEVDFQAEALTKGVRLVKAGYAQASKLVKAGLNNLLWTSDDEG